MDKRDILCVKQIEKRAIRDKILGDTCNGYRY